MGTENQSLARLGGARGAEESDDTNPCRMTGRDTTPCRMTGGDTIPCRMTGGNTTVQDERSDFTGLFLQKESVLAMRVRDKRCHSLKLTQPQK